MTISTQTRRKPQARRNGVEQHGAGWRVIKRWHDGTRHVESRFKSEREALARSIELDDLRDAGAPRPTSGRSLTLADVIERYLLDREGQRTAKGGEPLRESTLERERQAAKALLQYLDGAAPIRKLTRSTVLDAHRTRAKSHPKSAAEEFRLLRNALKNEHGIDHGILTIETSPVARRERRAITADEHRRLGGRHVGMTGTGLLPANELVNLLGWTGLRIGEALALRDADIEIDQRTHAMHLRIRTNKEGNRHKRVRVFHRDARALLYRALKMRDATRGPALLFADVNGRQLTYQMAYNRIWTPARTAASTAWRDAHPQHDPADDPYAELTPHDLRSTFATIARSDYGISRETTATLLGHRDGGALLARVYDKSDADALAERELDALAAGDAAGDTTRYQSSSTSPTAMEA